MKSAVMKSALMLAVLLCATLNVSAQNALQKPDAARGKATVAVCSACHGADGNAAGPTFPKLAGQHYDYLVKQLHNFKVKPGALKAERENAQMLAFASVLNEQQIRDVAAYFELQPLKPAVATHKDSYELGKKIYRAGIASKNVPACASCHGANGAGIPGQYPRLAGQWPEYSEAQLIAFRQGTRANNPVMTAIAQRLSDAEMKAIADYTAGLR